MANIRSKAVRTSELGLDALRQAGLRADDPLGQLYLRPLQKLPDPPKDANPINTYNFREAYVFCHACGRNNHYEGMTLELTDGSKVLIGNCCAKKIFDYEQYKKILHTRTQKEDSAYYKHVIAPFDIALTKTSSEVSGLMHLCQNI